MNSYTTPTILLVLREDYTLAQVRCGAVNKLLLIKGVLTFFAAEKVS